MVPNVHLSSAPIEEKIGSPKSGEVDLWECQNRGIFDSKIMLRKVKFLLHKITQTVLSLL